MIKYLLSHFSHPFFSQVIDLIPIKSGYSKDRKFKVVTNDYSTFFLRVHIGSSTHKIKHEYDLLYDLHRNGLNVSKPILYEIGNECAALVTTWIEGDILANHITKLSIQEQTLLGEKAALLLRYMHYLTNQSENNQSFYIRKIAESTIDFDLPEMKNELNCIQEFINNHIQLLYEKPFVIEHSDFHLGNLILCDSLYLIDFNGSHVGSIYDEFYKLELFDIEISRHYVKSMINTYFSSDERFTFFKIHRLYLAIACVNALRYGLQKDKVTLNKEIMRVKRILYDYDNFHLTYPLWYRL
ncbi:MAG: aminoglycoside phosphotransferase family protein [Acholeplasmataceae bacterium]|jgi:tRNA A-37 threonylcarbamoyl transferase component Bud32|nr:aminoglycoside phosphotransferase family protein [Acholeplasmataceae bacterium]